MAQAVGGGDAVTAEDDGVVLFRSYQDVAFQLEFYAGEVDGGTARCRPAVT